MSVLEVQIDNTFGIEYCHLINRAGELLSYVVSINLNRQFTFPAGSTRKVELRGPVNQNKGGQ